MKRPIAELLSVTLNAGAETERRQYEHEAWQILRRKQGYVTHRIYEELGDPLRRLVYSEWESKKAVDGARQYLQGTPLMRRARSVLSAAPQRRVVELVGPVTSTKGLNLSPNAVAVTAMTRLAQDDGAGRARHEQLWKTLTNQPGHLTHIRFQGFEEPLLVGSLSHWLDPDALRAVLAYVKTLAEAEVPQDMAYVQYRPVHD